MSSQHMWHGFAQRSGAAVRVCTSHSHPWCWVLFTRPKAARGPSKRPERVLPPTPSRTVSVQRHSRIGPMPSSPALTFRPAGHRTKARACRGGRGIDLQVTCAPCWRGRVALAVCRAPLRFLLLPRIYAAVNFASSSSPPMSSSSSSSSSVASGGREVGSASEVSEGAAV